MNSVSKKAHADERKRAAELAKLAEDDEARARRAALRAEASRAAKARAAEKAKARKFKMAGVWAVVAVGGFGALVWFADEMASWFHQL